MAKKQLITTELIEEAIGYGTLADDRTRAIAVGLAAIALELKRMNDLTDAPPERVDVTDTKAFEIPF